MKGVGDWNYSWIQSEFGALFYTEKNEDEWILEVVDWLVCRKLEWNVSFQMRRKFLFRVYNKILISIF